MAIILKFLLKYTVLSCNYGGYLKLLKVIFKIATKITALNWRYDDRTNCGGALFFKFYCIFMWQFQNFSKFQFFSEGRNQSPGGVCTPCPHPKLTYDFLLYLYGGIVNIQFWKPVEYRILLNEIFCSFYNI